MTRLSAVKRLAIALFLFGATFSISTAPVQADESEYCMAWCLQQCMDFCMMQHQQCWFSYGEWSYEFQWCTCHGECMPPI
jgi:hypothetical protein